MSSISLSPIGQVADPSRRMAPPRRNGWRESFRMKLYGLVALAAGLLIALQAFSIISEYRLLHEAKATEIRSISESAVGVLKVYDGMVKSGAMTREQAEQAAFAVLRGIRYGVDQDSVYIWRAADGMTLVHGDTSREGRNQFELAVDGRSTTALIADRLSNIRSHGGEWVYTVDEHRPSTRQVETRENVITLFEPWGLVVGTGTWLAGIEARLGDALLGQLIAVVIGAVLLVVASIAIVRSVMRQLGGEPAGAAVVMRKAAEGDFRESGGAAKLIPGSLLAAFGEMAGAIRTMIGQVRGEAGSLKQDAARLSESVDQVLSASAHQSEATASMAAAIEELTVSVNHISEAAVETERLSEDVATFCRSSEAQVASAARGMDRIAGAVGEASAKIASLESRAGQINAIAAVIKEIASQTNLLALNAAIEAARAGEHGRGFSVVADEVRKLAERTASATVEIEQTVAAVQQETRDSTETMGRVGPIVDEGNVLTQQVAQSLREIRGRADTTLERVREVANATREQSSASTSIAQRVEGIAQMVEQTTASMDETARSARDMRDMSTRLDVLMSRYTV
jgi:methyl-accepting chemotaxis protein